MSRVLLPDVFEVKVVFFCKPGFYLRFVDPDPLEVTVVCDLLKLEVVPAKLLVILISFCDFLGTGAYCCEILDF